MTREFVQAFFTSEDLENIQEDNSFFEDQLILGTNSLETFETVSLNSDSELNNLDSLEVVILIMISNQYLKI